jgi:hypothetical protein
MRIRTPIQKPIQRRPARTPLRRRRRSRADSLARFAAAALVAAALGLPARDARAGWFNQTTELIIGVPAMAVATVAGLPAALLGELVGIGREPGFLGSYVDHVGDGWSRALRFDR